MGDVAWMRPASAAVNHALSVLVADLIGGNAMHARDIDIVADVLAIRIDRFDVFLHNLPDEAWAAKGALGAVTEVEVVG